MPTQRHRAYWGQFQRRVTGALSLHDPIEAASGKSGETRVRIELER